MIRKSGDNLGTLHAKIDDLLALVASHSDRLRAIEAMLGERRTFPDRNGKPDTDELVVTDFFSGKAS